LKDLTPDRKAFRDLLTATPHLVFKTKFGEKCQHILERTQEKLDIKLYYPNAELFPPGGSIGNHRAVIVARVPSLKTPVIIGRKIKGGWASGTLRIWRPSIGFDGNGVVTKTVTSTAPATPRKKPNKPLFTTYHRHHKHNEASESDNESNVSSDTATVSQRGNRHGGQPANEDAENNDESNTNSGTSPGLLLGTQYAGQPVSRNSPIIILDESDASQHSSRSASLETESVVEEVQSSPTSSRSHGFTPFTVSTSGKKALVNIKTESHLDRERLPSGSFDDIVQFKFINKDNREVRQKSLKYCNTISKLFTQVRVARLLGEFQEDSLLCAQVDGGDDVFLAAGDDENFTALAKMIMERVSGVASSESKVCFVEIRVV
jgi:hypothetical protein